MEKSQQIFPLQVCLDEIETTTEYLKYITNEKGKKRRDSRERERGVRDITRKFRKRRWSPRKNAGGNPADCISRNSPPFCYNRLTRKKERETNEGLIEGNGSCGGEFGERVPRICSDSFFSVFHLIPRGGAPLLLRFWNPPPARPCDALFIWRT